MFFRLKSYLTFWVASTNQHGVHSPFVYKLATKCFYSRKKRASYTDIKTAYKNEIKKSVSFKNAKLLNRLIPYLNIQKVLIIEPDKSCIDQYLSLGNTIEISRSVEKELVYDCIYLDINLPHPQVSDLLEVLISKTHNDTVLLINPVSASEQNLLLWDTIKNHQRVKVTIDTFNLGFVFFRKEQATEHFVIRS